MATPFLEMSNCKAIVTSDMLHAQNFMVVRPSRRLCFPLWLQGEETKLQTLDLADQIVWGFWLNVSTTQNDLPQNAPNTRMANGPKTKNRKNDQ